jgi:hypothetical protein
MSLPVPHEPRHDGGRWETIRYAIDSNARTLRLCLIWTVSIVSPAAATVITLLVPHMLLCECGVGRMEQTFDRYPFHRACLDRSARRMGAGPAPAR